MKRDGREITVWVDLSPQVAADCVTTGTNRYERAKRNQWQSIWATSIEKDILGCYGEAGSANYCGVRWLGRLDSGPDKGFDLELGDDSIAQVRARRCGDWPCTLCHNKKPSEEKRFIFTEVWVQTPVRVYVYLLGWLWGYEIPIRGRWSTGDAYDKDCWSLHISGLHEANTLPRLNPPELGQLKFEL
jgi:hypothetical protein